VPNPNEPPPRSEVTDTLVVFVQALWHKITGERVWEHQARAIIAQSFTDSAILKRLEGVPSKWILRYVKDQGDEEWCVSTHQYLSFQATARNHRWKKYACFVLKYEKPSAGQLWKAIHEIAKREDRTVDEVITAIQNHISAVERLGELVEEP
jgi:hypothetical protein